MRLTGLTTSLSNTQSKESAESELSIDITFYGTVFNSAKYIRRSLTSIAETVLELKKYGINAEIVIVDNYSSDGTWEIMNELREQYSKMGVRMRFIRYRCSRGLGRNIALKFSRGSYLFFISDLDMEYNPYKLAEIIKTYITNPHLKDKCMYIFLTPRFHALSSGGINDLNRTEDIEFGARLLKRCIMIPVLDASMKPLSFSTFMKPIEFMPRPRFFVTTYSSERRYAKGLIGYFRRELRNKVDMIRGMGYTWRKIILEGLFLHGLQGLKRFVWILYHFAFFILAKFLHRKMYSYHKYINNGSLCDVAMFLNYVALIVNLSKVRTIDSTSLTEYIDAIKGMLKFRGNVITYFLRFEGKGLLRKALRGEYFKP